MALADQRRPNRNRRHVSGTCDQSNTFIIHGGEGTGAYPSSVWTKAGRVARLGILLKGTSAVHWRCLGTSPATSTPSDFCRQPTATEAWTLGPPPPPLSSMSPKTYKPSKVLDMAQLAVDFVLILQRGFGLNMSTRDHREDTTPYITQQLTVLGCRWGQSELEENMPGWVEYGFLTRVCNDRKK